jgi:PPOX class probable F420-dependent enzyme
MTTEIPAEFAHLLTEPLYGHLGTVRPDTTVQVNPMWFDTHRSESGDVTLRFTHTTKRAKYHNLQANPSMSYSIIDPENPFHYLELRGRLIEVIPDPEGAFYVHLGKRYGNPGQTPPPDSPDRVILVMSIEHTTHQ